MIKPHRYRTEASFACPRCGYGFVALERSNDLLCPECGLTSVRAACPPEWSVEIGPVPSITALVTTGIATFRPGRLAPVILWPRTIARPLRVLLVPVLALSFLQLLAIFLTFAVGGSAHPLAPYSAPTSGDFLLSRIPATAAMLLFLGIALLMSCWLSVLLARTHPRGRRTTITFRLWCYSVPHTVAVLAGWLFTRVIVLSNRPRPWLSPDIVDGLLIPLSTHTALAIALAMVEGAWWVSTSAALSGRSLD